jgi:hypothetical protein
MDEPRHGHATGGQPPRSGWLSAAPHPGHTGSLLGIARPVSDHRHGTPAMCGAAGLVTPYRCVASPPPGYPRASAANSPL